MARRLRKKVDGLDVEEYRITARCQLESKRRSAKVKSLFNMLLAEPESDVERLVDAFKRARQTHNRNGIPLEAPVTYERPRLVITNS